MTRSDDSCMTIRLILSTKRLYCDVRRPNMALTWMRCLWINFYKSSSLSTYTWALRKNLLYFEFFALSKSVVKRLFFSIFLIWLISRVKVETSPFRRGSFLFSPNFFKYSWRHSTSLVQLVFFFSFLSDGRSETMRVAMADRAAYIETGLTSISPRKNRMSMRPPQSPNKSNRL